MTKDFEDFLITIFTDSIKFTENDVLDDDFPDAFDNWLCNLDVGQWIEYGEKYGQFKENNHVTR